jgi:heat shock protein HtpX
MAFFAVLSVAMVIVSYLFVLLLAFTCVYLPFAVLDESEYPGVQTVLFLIFGVILGTIMLWSLLPRRDRFKPPGLRLDRAAHPRLFEEMEKIAAALNEPMPSEVYLISDVNAGVADRGGLLGFGSRRILALGLPLLSVLTISQFRAVLAHEFAHYYGGDTSLGPWVEKTQTAIVRVFQNIGSIRRLARIAVLGLMYLAVATLLSWYFKFFLRAVNLASRQREYRADELACMIAGRQPLIDGLRAIQSATMAWPMYWLTEVTPVLQSGALPSIAEGFSRFVAAPGILDQLQRGVTRHLKEEKSNPYDSHPPLRDRIEAARRISRDLVPSNLVREDTRSARSLLDQASLTELRLLELAMPELKPATLKHISWAEVGARVMIPQWKKFVAEYSSLLTGVTAQSLSDQVQEFSRIGDNMRNPAGLVLDAKQRTRRASQLFAAGLALALLDRGWKLVTEPGIFYLRGEKVNLNPFLEVERLAAGKLSADEWLARCRLLGIAEVPLVSTPALAPAAQHELPGMQANS